MGFGYRLYPSYEFLGNLFTSPFEKGGLRGIYLIKSPLTPLFQRGGLNDYVPCSGSMQYTRL